MPHFIVKARTFSAKEKESKPGYWILEAENRTRALEAWTEEYDNSAESLHWIRPVKKYADADEDEDSAWGFVGFSETSTPT